MQKQTICIAVIFFSSISLVAPGFDSSYDSVPVEKNQENQNVNPAVTVEMTNTMKFTPDTVRIKVGETVKWNNTSLLAHPVTGDPSQATIKGSAQLPKGAKPFNSGIMGPKQIFSHTFKVAGTYQYFCIPHEGTEMYGWVIVEE